MHAGLDNCEQSYRVELWIFFLKKEFGALLKLLMGPKYFGRKCLPSVPRRPSVLSEGTGSGWLRGRRRIAGDAFPFPVSAISAKGFCLGLETA